MNANIEILTVNNHLRVVVLDRKSTYQEKINVVLCAIVGRTEYATWIENLNFLNQPAFFNGYYTLDLDAALEDFKNRS